MLGNCFGAAERGGFERDQRQEPRRTTTGNDGGDRR
jgi:hypothetical protein